MSVYQKSILSLATVRNWRGESGENILNSLSLLMGLLTLMCYEGFSLGFEFPLRLVAARCMSFILFYPQHDYMNEIALYQCTEPNVMVEITCVTSTLWGGIGRDSIRDGGPERGKYSLLPRELAMEAFCPPGSWSSLIANINSKVVAVTRIFCERLSMPVMLDVANI